VGRRGSYRPKSRSWLRSGELSRRDGASATSWGSGPGPGSSAQNPAEPSGEPEFPHMVGELVKRQGVDRRAVAWWGSAVVVARGAVRGRPGCRDVRSASYAGAGYPKTLVSSHGPLSNIEHGPEGLLIGNSRNAVVRDAGRARAASPAATGCRSGSVCEGDLPAESGELAGDRHRDDAVGLLARVLERSPAGVQPALRSPGDVDDVG